MPPEGRRQRGTEPPLEPQREHDLAVSCLDFGFLALKTMKEYISVV